MFTANFSRTTESPQWLSNFTSCTLLTTKCVQYFFCVHPACSASACLSRPSTQTHCCVSNTLLCFVLSQKQNILISNWSDTSPLPSDLDLRRFCSFTRRQLNRCPITSSSLLTKQNKTKNIPAPPVKHSDWMFQVCKGKVVASQVWWLVTNGDSLWQRREVSQQKSI